MNWTRCVYCGVLYMYVCVYVLYSSRVQFIHIYIYMCVCIIYHTRVVVTLLIVEIGPGSSFREPFEVRLKMGLSDWLKRSLWRTRDVIGCLSDVYVCIYIYYIYPQWSSYIFAFWRSLTSRIGGNQKMDDLGFWSIWQSELLLNHFAVLYRGGYNDLINPGLTLQNLWPCFPMLSMFEIKLPVALRRKQQLNLPTAKCYVWVNIHTGLYKIEAFMLNMTNVCGSGINHDLTLPRVLIHQNLVLIRLVSILASRSPLSPATGG